MDYDRGGNGNINDSGTRRIIMIMLMMVNYANKIIEIVMIMIMIMDFLIPMP